MARWAKKTRLADPLEHMRKGMGVVLSGVDGGFEGRGLEGVGGAAEGYAEGSAAVEVDVGPGDVAASVPGGADGGT